MTGRAREIMPMDLTVSEVVALQAANSEEGTYAYSLAQKFGIEDELKTGAIYRRLRVLTELGYLNVELESIDVALAHPGPARRIYRTTDEGRTTLGEVCRLMGVEPSEQEF